MGQYYLIFYAFQLLPEREEALEEGHKQPFFGNVWHDVDSGQ